MRDDNHLQNLHTHTTYCDGINNYSNSYTFSCGGDYRRSYRQRARPTWQSRRNENPYAGQLNFYLSAVDGILKKETDNPSIGLLLCKSKNDLVAEYALKDMSKPIGVSEYKITSSLPEDLEKQLPSVEDIQKRIKK